MRDFRELRVWREAHELTLAVYKATSKFPREEVYGLTSQLRRASSSIPANIAEGCGRAGEAELARFCTIAAGSASEVEYHLLLALDLKLIEPAQHRLLETQATNVKRMLAGLLQKLKAEGGKRTAEDKRRISA